MGSRTFNRFVTDLRTLENSNCFTCINSVEFFMSWYTSFEYKEDMHKVFEINKLSFNKIRPAKLLMAIRIESFQIFIWAALWQ